MTNKPSIYVACLASYNAGRLHGRWIDATQDLDDIWSEIREMLAESDIDEVAEEWAIHDYDEYGDLRECFKIEFSGKKRLAKKQKTP